jgi:hypothetical protein
MNTEDIKPGNFCYHYKNPDKIYQIVGIARTDDVNSHDIYNKKAHFFARDVDNESQCYIGFIFPNQDIVISLNKNDRVVNDKYVIYNAFTFDDYHEPRIWARKLPNFAAEIEIESKTYSRFYLL